MHLKFRGFCNLYKQTAVGVARSGESGVGNFPAHH